MQTVCGTLDLFLVCFHFLVVQVLNNFIPY